MVLAAGQPWAAAIDAPEGQPVQQAPAVLAVTDLAAAAAAAAAGVEAPGDQAASDGDLSAVDLARVRQAITSSDVLSRVLTGSNVQVTIPRAGTWTKNDGVTSLGYVAEIRLNAPVNVPLIVLPAINYDDATDSYSLGTLTAALRGLTGLTALLDSSLNIVSLAPDRAVEVLPAPGQHVERESTQ